MNNSNISGQPCIINVAQKHTEFYEQQKRELLDNDIIPQFLGFSDSENKESEPENNIVNKMSDGARGQWVLLNTG